VKVLRDGKRLLWEVPKFSGSFLQTDFKVMQEKVRQPGVVSSPLKLLRGGNEVL
jgi:hypothetical protein